MKKNEARPLESIQEAAAEAEAAGHVLTAFKRVENGFQAGCIECDMTTWVGFSGMRYSLLSNQCNKEEV